MVGTAVHGDQRASRVVVVGLFPAAATVFDDAVGDASELAGDPHEQFVEVHLVADDVGLECGPEMRQIQLLERFISFFRKNSGVLNLRMVWPVSTCPIRSRNA